MARCCLSVLLAATACLANASEVASEKAAPAPWPTSAEDADASVASWASGALNELRLTKQQAPPSDPFRSPPAAFDAPVGGRYGAPAPPPMRPKPLPLPHGNPLRGMEPAAESAAPHTPAAFDTAAAARDAFDGPAEPLPPAPFAPAARIAVGASPIASAEPEAVAIPVEALDEPSLNEPARFTAPAAPIRVAASAASEPATFESDFRPTTAPAGAAPTEGLGQPGPPELDGPQRAALVIEKRAPDEVTLGAPARFAVRVRNTGDGRAENVVLTDQVPAGARFLSASPTAQREGGRLVWRLGALEPGGERIVEVRFEPTREGPLGSVATVTMDASASGSTRCTRPALALRVASGGPVKIGAVQTVAIEVHNPGTGTANGVMLVGDVPPQVTHPAGRELEYEVGALGPGETRRIELKLTGQAAGRVASLLRVVGQGGLAAEQSFAFDVVAPSLAVSIDGPKRRYLERAASYTIGIDNPGTAPAKDVRLVTHLPQGMEFVRANNLGEYDAATHSVYWSLAELPEGERGEVQVVAMPVAAGEHTLRVESESAGGLRAAEAHRVSVDGVASLAFEVRDLNDPIEIGANTLYEIRVLNEGTKAATGVRVRVEAPPGLRVLAAEGQTPARTAADRAEFAPLPRLEPGEKVAYRVQVEAQQPGDQRLAVLVESDDLSRPIRREESTRVFGDE